MAESELKAGLTVWLKTGGPAMTTKAIRPGGLWKCSWFVGTELKEGEFHPDQLTQEDPDKDSGPKMNVSYR